MSQCIFLILNFHVSAQSRSVRRRCPSALIDIRSPSRVNLSHGTKGSTHNTFGNRGHLVTILHEQLPGYVSSPKQNDHVDLIYYYGTAILCSEINVLFKDLQLCSVQTDCAVFLTSGTLMKV